jgi:hypothetical protein
VRSEQPGAAIHPSLIPYCRSLLVAGFVPNQR